MKWISTLALAAVAVCTLSALPACEKSRDEMRPDMDKISTENGLQSRDLREMTDKMAPDLLAIPEIAQSPTKVTIVVKGVINKLDGNQTRDLSIYAARLAGLLATAAHDRIAFVEESATVNRIASEELGNPDPFETASRNPGAPSAKIQPQYALYGEFHSMRNSKNTYYLCQFKLLNIVTGQLVWQNQYETLTLNLR
jgi:hypothetical protein